MGLFDLFKGKPKHNIEEKGQATFSLDIAKDKKRTKRFKSMSDLLDYVKDNCDAIQESKRQTEEAKKEYQAVTSYLTDMQKIEMIPLEQRGKLYEAAKNIVTLTREREKFQNRKDSPLSEQQYHIFEQYELQIPKELPKLKENELLREAIEQDMNHLEDERLDLEDEQEDISSKQSFLRGIAIIISMVVVFLFTLFIMLKQYTGGNYVLPFSMTVLMGMVATFYIVREARKNESEVNVVHQKQKRLVTLLNKITIKSVNNLNYLEYTYNKYGVESFDQFKTLWNEYRRIKEEASKYQRNTDDLEYFNKELIQELRKFGISDCEIWILQASAILDMTEMTDIRHRLNIRRQKLRERIDLNIKQAENSIQEISKIRFENPESENETDKLLRSYRIDLNDEEA